MSDESSSHTDLPCRCLVVLSESAAMAFELAPSEIRFTHATINSKFICGRSVNEAIDQILSGEMDLYDLPTIRVGRHDGKYYGFDNRRLYVYRVLEREGFLNQVIVNKGKLKWKRVTTENDGMTVKLNHAYRGNDILYPHAPLSADNPRPSKAKQALAVEAQHPRSTTSSAMPPLASHQLQEAPPAYSRVTQENQVPKTDKATSTAPPQENQVPMTDKATSTAPPKKYESKTCVIL